jgi:nickel and cobalt resistance protein CnrR
MSMDPSGSREPSIPDTERLRALLRQRARSSNWKLPWGGVLVTILLAGIAAFAGARLGSSKAPVPTAPLSDRVFEVLGDGTDLSAQQQARINAIADRYASVRAQLRLQSRTLNVTLARLMAEESGFGPKTEESLRQLQVVMGERLKLSMEYMLEVRQVLTAEQRVRFDRRVEEDAMVSR